jgi:hypothetical protein
MDLGNITLLLESILPECCHYLAIYASQLRYKDFNVRRTKIRYQWFSSVYLYLPNITEALLTEYLREGILKYCWILQAGHHSHLSPSYF